MNCFGLNYLGLASKDAEISGCKTLIIHSFLIGLREKGENGVTPGRPDNWTPGRQDHQYSVKSLRSGHFLIEVGQKRQADIMLKVTMLHNKTVTVEPHKEPNTSKGIVYCEHLKNFVITHSKTWQKSLRP